MPTLQYQHIAQQWSNMSPCQSEKKQSLTHTHTHIHKGKAVRRGDKGKEGGLECGRAGETDRGGTKGEMSGKTDTEKAR